MLDTDTLIEMDYDYTTIPSIIDGLIDNDETLEMIEHINAIVVAKEQLLHARAISDTSDDFFRAMRVLDTHNELNIDMNDVAALENIELKVELALEDMTSLWRMLGAVLYRLSTKFKEKAENYQKIQEENIEKVFHSRELVQSKFTGQPISNIMDAILYSQIGTALNSITRHIPRSIYIVQTESDYARIIRSCNFDQGMQKLSLRMGRFFAVGKNKAKVKQFYQTTTYVFEYRKDIPANVAGYQASLKAMEDLYKNTSQIAINVCRHIQGAMDGYAKELRAIGMRLSRLPDKPESYKLANLQIKLINDYLRLVNVIDTRMDTTYSRINSLVTVARQVSKENKSAKASNQTKSRWF